MKRSKSINLDAMRKPVGMGLAVAGSALLGACSDEARVFETVEQCVTATRCEYNCTTAYQQARQEADRTAPQFSRQDDCEYEFGTGECDSLGNGQFAPRMAAFMLPDDDQCDDRNGSGGYVHRYYGRSLYSPRSASSPARDRWVTGEGDVLGSRFQNTVSVPGNAFDQAPTQRTSLSRGGFGSTIKARGVSSGWGG